MRSFAGYLLLEDVLDNIPDQVSLMSGLATSVFNPSVLIVENDCGTTLGKSIDLTFESEGLVASDTLEPLTRDRIYSQLAGGTYTKYIRHTSSCISNRGICATCYTSTYPDEDIPKVNDRVSIKTEYLVNSEVIEAKPFTLVLNTLTDPELYSKHYLYRNGFLLEEGTDYTLINSILTLTVPFVEQTFLTLRCVNNTRTPYMSWLAKSYSGYLLGMKPLPSEKLQVPALYLSSELEGNRLQLVADYVMGLEQVPKQYKDYIASIRDPLEKSLYLLAVFTIYYNATT